MVEIGFYGMKQIFYIYAADVQIHRHVITKVEMKGNAKRNWSFNSKKSWDSSIRYYFIGSHI